MIFADANEIFADAKVKVQFYIIMSKVIFANNIITSKTSNIIDREVNIIKILISTYFRQSFMVGKILVVIKTLHFLRKNL